MADDKKRLHGFNTLHLNDKTMIAAMQEWANSTLNGEVTVSSVKPNKDGAGFIVGLSGVEAAKNA